MLRLFTFTISHFSEKARWALDHNRLAFEERTLLPLAHMLVVRRRAKSTEVPLLEHDGAFVQGSGAILDYLEARLDAKALAVAPGDVARAAELEARADRALGRGTQRIFYDVLLDRRDDVVDLFTQRGPRWGRAFYRVFFPVVRRGIRRRYRVRPDVVAKAKDDFRAMWDDLDALLADGRPYFMGDRMTRVDVTIASLLAPTCRPAEHLMKWPPPAPALVPFVRAFEDRPTFRHVLRLYREHRRRPAD